MKQKNGSDERQYWVWIASPEHYLDELGNDRDDLDPESGYDPPGWWTCHKDTREGDLILLYRSRIKKDFGYLMQAASKAYSLADNKYAALKNWDYGCDYRVLRKFKNPVTLQEVRANFHLHDWVAYTTNFRRRVYSITPKHWKRLNQMASSKNRGFATYLAQVE